MISFQISTGIKGIALLILQFFSSCHDGFTYDENGQVISSSPGQDSIKAVSPVTTAFVTDSLYTPKAINPDSIKAAPVAKIPDTAKVNTKAIRPEQIVEFAETQVGVRYKYGSINPKVGFDCSGFITYVFNHFDIRVPRSSVDFSHLGRAVPLENARKGDLILFTGTNHNIRVVGHMGIIFAVDSSEIKFIHSSSGKANGVTITPLNGYYKNRFVSIRRIFPQNNF